MMNFNQNDYMKYFKKSSPTICQIKNKAYLCNAIKESNP